MTLGPGLRKLNLTAHVIMSVGWIGIVAGFLALAIAGAFSTEMPLVRASYAAMDVIYRAVVIPSGSASLLTGVIASLGTDWGLFRHYWVLLKLLLTVPAVCLMLAHVKAVADAARMASAMTPANDGLSSLRAQLLIYSATALLVLLTATVLSTYKPRGRTGFGLGKSGRRSTPINGASPRSAQ
jgi:hypothetical protein